MSEHNILGSILAGGQSKRMGKDKSFLEINNKKLIEYSIDKVKKYLKDLIIVTNNDNEFFLKNNLTVVKDCIEGQLGPLVGILTAMKWAKDNHRKYSWVATFPCDTPFFDENLVDKIMDCPKKSSKKLFFIKSGNKRHNIFGLWSMELKEILLKDIDNGIRKVEDWANKVGSEIIEINSDNDYNFLNINTKEDLEEAKKKIK